MAGWPISFYEITEQSIVVLETTEENIDLRLEEMGGLSRDKNRYLWMQITKGQDKSPSGTVVPEVSEEDSSENEMKSSPLGRSTAKKISDPFNRKMKAKDLVQNDRRRDRRGWLVAVALRDQQGQLESAECSSFSVSPILTSEARTSTSRPRTGSLL